MAKKTGDNSQYQKLKNDIAAGSIGSLYLFWGEESYLREYYLGEMVKKLVDDSFRDFNYRVFEGKDTDLAELSAAVDTVPIFSDRTMTVVRGLDIFANEDVRTKMEALVEELPEYGCLVIVFDAQMGKPPGNTRLYKSIDRNGSIVEFASQGQNDLMNWIARRFKAYNCSISRDNAEYLLFLCGSLMDGLIPEIEKIAAYNGPGVVTREAIDAAAVPLPSAVVFRMTDAIAAKEFDRAAEIMGELIASREKPQMLLSLIARQLRQLYTARLIFDRGGDAGAVRELWKLTSDYPARSIFRMARGFSADWLRETMLMCAEADLEMKSTGTDAETVLYSFFIKLASGGR